MCSINGMEMPLWDQKDSEEISAALISFLINDVLFRNLSFYTLKMNNP